MQTLFPLAEIPTVEKPPPEHRAKSPADKKLKKRMHNILYRARRKGLHIVTLHKTIFYDVQQPEQTEITQVKKLTAEFNFCCQAEIKQPDAAD